MLLLSMLLLSFLLAFYTFVVEPTAVLTTTVEPTILPRLRGELTKYTVL